MAPSATIDEPVAEAPEEITRDIGQAAYGAPPAMPGRHRPPGRLSPSYGGPEIEAPAPWDEAEPVTDDVLTPTACRA